MAHPEQREFIKSAIEKIMTDGTLRRVIEIGSYDVNGEIRSLFATASLEKYVGVDLVEGPGVDIVGFGHELKLESEHFDLAISVECFEHDRYWPLTFKRMADLVRPGGWLVFTCASRGRPEHGTRRSDPLLSPGTSSRGLDYYQNLTEQDFIDRCHPNGQFRAYQFVSNGDVFDLYFIGQKGDEIHLGAPSMIINDAEIRRIHEVTTTAHMLIRLPLRILSRVLPERAYQEFAYRYWKWLNWLQERFFDSRFSRR